jgi:hypothetical protein
MYGNNGNNTQKPLWAPPTDMEVAQRDDVSKLADVLDAHLESLSESRSALKSVRANGFVSRVTRGPGLR